MSIYTIADLTCTWVDLQLGDCHKQWVETRPLTVSAGFQSCDWNDWNPAQTVIVVFITNEVSRRSSNTIPTSARCSTRTFPHMESFSCIFPAIINNLLPIAASKWVVYALSYPLYNVLNVLCQRKYSNQGEQNTNICLLLLIQPLLVTWNYWLSFLQLCCRATLPLRHPLLLWLQFESACGSSHFFPFKATNHRPKAGATKIERL